MDEKSTRNSRKVKDVEDVMIERSIRMKEGAKTKIQIFRYVLVKQVKGALLFSSVGSWDRYAYLRYIGTFLADVSSCRSFSRKCWDVV